jgi:TolA protein
VEHNSEKRLIKGFLWASFIVHLLAFILDPGSLFPFLFPPPKVLDVSTWEIPVEVANDEWAKADKDSISQVKQAEELRVRENLLAQLPKSMTLEETGKKPQEIAEATPEAPPKKEEPEQKEAEKPKEAEEHIEQDKEAAVALKKEEAIARLLKEKARLKEKFAKQDESPLNDLLVQRKNELMKNQSSKALSVGDNDALKGYQGLLKSWVQKHYVLPEVYATMEGQTLAVIEIVLSERGELRQLKLVQTSKNPAFDSLAMKTMENSVPFPVPPKDLVGVPIRYRFDHNM